jgi:hypothetical protein
MTVVVSLVWLRVSMRLAIQVSSNQDLALSPSLLLSPVPGVGSRTTVVLSVLEDLGTVGDNEVGGAVAIARVTMLLSGLMGSGDDTRMAVSDLARPVMLLEKEDLAD